ncbi:S-layer homology domain-containing protein [Paenibacillus sp. LHD-117]|uniref:S-layer homology domain-containing protein n=1 Tax=Paenibacillus sp. LHD-117 TaxID=3071412 RepID=UPI0027E1EE34|nr:S-layer homology domain-containing protein [Paenibacillus sp. LHD-117]MDQ6422157.1 S-layer homology domain-containing protein [Paenibacillus sp. LHD-117]
MKRKLWMNSMICMLCSMLWLGSAGAESVSDFSMKTSVKESAEELFTITLQGDQIKDMYAYEAKFQFDPAQLEVVKAETTIKGFSVQPVVKDNVVTIAHTKVGKVGGEKGSLDITTVTFKAKKAGSSQVKWTSMRLIDSNMKDQAFTPNTTTTFTKLFRDVVKHWAKADIMEMVSIGVVEGVDKERFAPDSHVTRAQFATLLARALKLDAAKGTVPFQDVKPGAWYADTVKKAYAAGIINGVSSTSFAPDKKITREEMTAMLMRAKAYADDVDVNSLAAGTIDKFNDKNKISVWAQKSVAYTISSGLMKGRTTTTFAPKENATRAESAVVIKRLLS